MGYPKIVTTVGLVAALALVMPSTSSAQGRARGRAVPRGSAPHGSAPRGSAPRGSVQGGSGQRGSVRVARPPVRVVPYRSYYRPTVNLGFFYGRPGYFGSYGFGVPFYGYGYPAYGSLGLAYDSPGYGYAPYGYGYGGYSGRPYGGVRIDLPQRDAEVYVDGYFVGTVDNFDGVLQQANIEAGPHRIEVRHPDFETITFDVNVEPGRTITYRASMRPLRP